MPIVNSPTAELVKKIAPDYVKPYIFADTTYDQLPAIREAVTELLDRDWNPTRSPHWGHITAQVGVVQEVYDAVLRAYLAREDARPTFELLGGRA